MENPENVLQELNQFEREPVESLPRPLEEYLQFVARTGNTVFPWHKIKPAVRAKLETVIADFSLAMPEEQIPKMPNVDTFKFTEMKQRIFEQLDSYSGIPFTIQRLCELLTQPKRHYKRVDKLMRGLEKVMLVVSTVEPLPRGGAGGQEGGARGAAAGEGDRGERERGEGEPALAMESPSKRIRLSSAEDEAGPCDSQDGAGQAPPQENGGIEENGDSEAAGPSGASPRSSSPAAGGAASEEENMDIDAECTSSGALVGTSPPGSRAGLGPPGQGTEQPAPAGDSDTGVTTSAAPGGPEPSVGPSPAALAAAGPGEPAPSSSEGSGALEEGSAAPEESGAPDCSSDQAMVAGRDSASPTNSEAEPAGEVAEEEEAVREEAEEEESPPGSVQSSGGQVVDRAEEEVAGGAADSSDMAMAAAGEEGGKVEANTAPEETEDTSPDQSDTA